MEELKTAYASSVKETESLDQRLATTEQELRTKKTEMENASRIEEEKSVSMSKGGGINLKAPRITIAAEDKEYQENEDDPKAPSDKKNANCAACSCLIY